MPKATVEKVKTSSNAVMDGITVVRELAAENKHGSDVVMLGMNELTQNNSKLEDRTASSKSMTSGISTQVQHVTDMIEEMVALTTESEKHALTSSTDLDGLVKTAGTMAELSSKVEQILQSFKEEFSTVKQLVWLIWALTLSLCWDAISMSTTPRAARSATSCWTLNAWAEG